MASDPQRERRFYLVTAGRLVLVAGLAAFSLLFTPPGPVAGRRFCLAAALAAMAGAVAVALWYRRTHRRELPAYTQIVLDLLLITLAVWWSGGMDSPFVFLYPVAIIAGCLQAGRRGGSAALVLAVAGFGVVTLLHPSPEREPAETARLFFIDMAAFSATAYLGRELVRQMSQAEERLDSARLHLRQSREIQRHLADSMEAGLAVADPQGRVILWNRAAERITAVPREEAVGRPLRAVAPYLAQALEGPEGARQELELPRPEGGKRIIGMSTFQIKGEGADLGRGVIFQDITQERERAAHLQRIDRLVALGEMAAGLAHEIRNPLASISGVAQFVMEQGLVEERGRKLLELMERECRRLTEITESFLQYARPPREEPSRVEVRQEVEEVVALIRRRKDLPDARVEVEVEEGLELSVDRARFRQLLHNCILNAFQAVSPGGTIRVEAGRTGEGAVIAIEDDGPGIPPELMERVFDPFFTTRQDGTGLGLSICHNIVVSWGGEIEITPREGGGTRVAITLPSSPPHRGPDPGGR